MKNSEKDYASSKFLGKIIEKIEDIEEDIDREEDED